MSSNKVTTMSNQVQTLKEAALAYAARGWTRTPPHALAKVQESMRIHKSVQGCNVVGRLGTHDRGGSGLRSQACVRDFSSVGPPPPPL